MRRVLLVACMGVVLFGLAAGAASARKRGGKMIELPDPSKGGKVSLEQAIAKRRSVRRFSGEALSLEQLGQLAWAAQGITLPERGFRAAPSAGALYPLELYFVTPEAVYHYVPLGHRFEVHREGDMRRSLSEAALMQAFIAEAPLSIVVTAVFERTARKYGKRAGRYVYMEMGHVGQNVLLEAIALGLGAVPVGAFEDARVSRALSLPRDHDPGYIITVGRPR